MKSLFPAVRALMAAAMLAGCATDMNTTEEGFRFPIVMGDIAKGREAFIALGCNRCHTVNGVELPAWQGDSPTALELGGEVIHVKTYGELLTSIINPNHVLSGDYLARLPRGERGRADSPMPFRHEMTVEQLVDIVTFLNSRYVLLAPAYSPGPAGEMPDYQ
jgi:hypothetical protein